MKPLEIAISLLLVAATACTGGVDRQPQGFAEKLRGTWELFETSGGISGAVAGIPDGERPRIVVTADDVLERNAPDGGVTREPFTLRRGKTIFSVEEQWFLEFDSGAPPLVAEIYPDGRLVLSENVYDGVSSTFRRIAE